ncbi:hypothetical protein AOLI_G00189810 [Acnodon oligacanthus]
MIRSSHFILTHASTSRAESRPAEPLGWTRTPTPTAAAIFGQCQTEDLRTSCRPGDVFFFSRGSKNEHVP